MEQFSEKPLLENSLNIHFLVDDPSGVDTPFRDVARNLHIEPKDHEFRYGEYLNGGGGYFAIYAEVHKTSSYAELDARADDLYGKVLLQLGSFGLHAVQRDEYDSVFIRDEGGNRRAILSGRSLAGGRGNFTHWGIRPFPLVDLEEKQ